jgi:hypothetical protein
MTAKKGASSHRDRPTGTAGVPPAKRRQTLRLSEETSYETWFALTRSLRAGRPRSR